MTIPACLNKDYMLSNHVQMELKAKGAKKLIEGLGKFKLHHSTEKENIFSIPKANVMNYNIYSLKSREVIGCIIKDREEKGQELDVIRGFNRENLLYYSSSNNPIDLAKVFTFHDKTSSCIDVFVYNPPEY